jgi:hypothetical protein
LAGSYQFQTVSDDGIRVYVGGQLVIDNWTDHAPTINTSGAITFAANAKADIVVEFYERGGGAVSRLQWKAPGAPGFVAIPRDRLYSGTSSGGGGIDTNVAYSLVNRNSSKCIDVSGNSTADNAAAIQWTCHGGANQKFKFTPTSSGYYRVVAQHSSKVLRPSGGSTTNGAAIVQTTWGNLNSQQWRPVSVGGGYYKLLNRHTGKAMEIASCSTADTARVQQWTDNNSACQAFRLQ